MRKCEKILFNNLDKQTRHEVCKSFLEEERKLQMKNKKSSK
jgi:hypothetical protein